MEECQIPGTSFLPFTSLLICFVPRFAVQTLAERLHSLDKPWPRAQQDIGRNVVDHVSRSDGRDVAPPNAVGQCLFRSL